MTKEGKNSRKQTDRQEDVSVFLAILFRCPREEMEEFGGILGGLISN